MVVPELCPLNVTVYCATGIPYWLGIEDFAFEPVKQYELILANVDDFVNDLKSLSKIYGYHQLIKRVPITRKVDPNGENNITFGHANILKTWNQIDSDTVQKNATQTWGDKSWTVTQDKQIVLERVNTISLYNSGPDFTRTWK